MNSDVFEKYSISKAVFTLAAPTMLSMLVTILYNMVDTFFVGQTGDYNQVAAVSLTTPVFVMCLGIALIFGVGGSTFISRSLGSGDDWRVKRISSFCFYAGAATGFLLMAIFLIFMPTILDLIGSSDNTRAFAGDYLKYIALGAPFIVVSNAFGNVVRGEGAARVSMTGMMLGTIVNIVLDPIMILSMGMGVAGAAIVTVIGNICSVVYYIFYLTGKKTMLSISPKDFRPGRAIAKNVIMTGVPASLNNLLMSISNIVLNNFLVKYGDIPVAAMGVAMKANMLVIMLQMGLAIGVQPLVAYNYGARRMGKMKKVMKFSGIINIIMGVTLTAAYIVLGRTIIAVFFGGQTHLAAGIDMAKVIDLGTQMLNALMISGPFIGIFFIFSFAIQAMGKIWASLTLSIARQGLVFLPVLIVSNMIFGLDGIIFSQPIADVASLILSVILFFVVTRKLPKGDEQALRPSPSDG